jgi:hypothetical protein
MLEDRLEKGSRKNNRLGYALSCSVGIHICAMVLSLMYSHEAPAALKYVMLDLEYQDGKQGAEEESEKKGYELQKRVAAKRARNRKSKNKRSRKRRSKKRKAAPKKQEGKTENISKEATATKQEKNQVSDLSSAVLKRYGRINKTPDTSPEKRVSGFRPNPHGTFDLGMRRKDKGVQVASRETKGGYRITTYQDGGRTITNLTDRNIEIPRRDSETWNRDPDVFAGMGNPNTLEGLSMLPLWRGGSGRTACDYYRDNPSDGKDRVMYLMVDASGSMRYKVSKTHICAAGAAMSALRNGYSVAVISFADSQKYLAPTKDKAMIQRFIQEVGYGSTKMPSLPDLAAAGVDLVMVTDGMFNVLADHEMSQHRRAISKAGNRGMIYLLQLVCTNGPPTPTYPYYDLKSAGYNTKKVDVFIGYCRPGFNH